MNPAEWLVVTGRMYWKAFREAALLSAANWPVLGTLFVYPFPLMIAARLVAPLGMIGGFILGFVSAACISSFLYLVEMIVRTSKVSLEDFRNSFSQYLNDVLGVLFLSWIFSMLVSQALLRVPNGLLLLAFIQFVLFVLFNAVPELIYLGHFSATGLLRESYSFISVNWIEWFPANFLAVGVLYSIWLPDLGGVLYYAQLALGNLAIYFIAVMRGILFIELYNTNARSRAFKYRSGG